MTRWRPVQGTSCYATRRVRWQGSADLYEVGHGGDVAGALVPGWDDGVRHRRQLRVRLEERLQQAQAAATGADAELRVQRQHHQPANIVCLQLQRSAGHGFERDTATQEPFSQAYSRYWQAQLPYRIRTAVTHDEVVSASAARNTQDPTCATASSVKGFQ